MSGASIIMAYAPSAVYRLDDGSYYDLALDPGDAEIILTLTASGILSVTGTGGTSYQYVTGSPPSSLEVRFTETAGTVTSASGTMATWLPLSSDQYVMVTRTTLGAKAATLTVEIGLLGASTAIETATITLTAQVDS